MSRDPQPPSPSLVGLALVDNFVLNEADVGSGVVDSLKPKNSWQKSSPGHKDVIQEWQHTHEIERTSSAVPAGPA